MTVRFQNSSTNPVRVETSGKFNFWLLITTITIDTFLHRQIEGTQS